jgi:hypothetical protein
MPRPKGSKNKKEEMEEVTETSADVVMEVDVEVVPNPIAKLPVDYGREDLNNIAKKVNEIIDAL